jgi:hypothetical protein
VATNHGRSRFFGRNDALAFMLLDGERRASMETVGLVTYLLANRGKVLLRQCMACQGRRI